MDLHELLDGQQRSKVQFQIHIFSFNFILIYPKGLFQKEKIRDRLIINGSSFQ